MYYILNQLGQIIGGGFSNPRIAIEEIRLLHNPKRWANLTVRNLFYKNWGLLVHGVIAHRGDYQFIDGCQTEYGDGEIVPLCDLCGAPFTDGNPIARHSPDGCFHLACNNSEGYDDLQITRYQSTNLFCVVEPDGGFYEFGFKATDEEMYYLAPEEFPF